MFVSCQATAPGDILCQRRPAVVSAGVSVKVLFVLGSLLPFVLSAETFMLKSPDGRLEVNIDTNQQLQYQLKVDGEVLIKPSAIGLEFADGLQFGKNAEVQSQQQQSVNEKLTPEVKVRTAQIRNNYNELNLDFKQHFSLKFRVFNEGVAYRFEGKQQGQAELKAEQANFNFVAGTYSYFPFEKNFRTATQPTFTPLPAKNIDGDELGSLPALFVAKGVNLLLTETDLQDYPGLWLQGHGDGRIYGVHPKDLDLTKQNPQNLEQTASSPPVLPQCRVSVISPGVLLAWPALMLNSLTFS